MQGVTQLLIRVDHRMWLRGTIISFSFALYKSTCVLYLFVELNHESNCELH